MSVKKIEIFYEDIQPIKLLKSNIKNPVISLIDNEIRETGEISLIFCSDKYLLKINQKYLKHNYLTDIITFDYVKKNTISGDLFISIDRVKENASKFNTSWTKELFRVIFHGILHLIGYNDKTEEERKIMREKEDYYLNKVDFSEIEK